MWLRIVSFLSIVLLAAGVYWYSVTAALCPAPIAYRLGTLDSAFGISTETALAEIQAAEVIWEEEAGRELFVYDPNAVFTVNFIFDERQENADSEAQQRNELDARWSENEQLLTTISALQEKYEALSVSYKQKADAYETQLTAYNKKVTKYNDRGGAPTDVYDELERERESLSAQMEALNSLADDLNRLAGEINQLSEQGNRLVDSYNQDVEQYNTAFGVEREFTQGDYQQQQIDVYKFSNFAELETVLAHEFGHALGIDHVEGSSSLMYYLLEEGQSSRSLSVADREAYYQVCGVSETMSQKVRRSIRTALNKFN